MAYRILLPLLFFVSASISVIAQQQTILKGSLEGIADNTKVYVESNSGVKDSCLTKNQRFELSLKAPNQYDVYFINIKKYPDSSRYGFPLFIKEGSVTQFDLNKQLRFKISGDSIAEEQNAYYEGLWKLSDELKLIETQFSFTIDQFKLNTLKEQLNKATINSNTYPTNWIKQHITSPFSVAVLRFFVYTGSPSRNKRDTLAEHIYDLFPIEATKNNYQASILRSQFAFFSNSYEAGDLYSDAAGNAANDRYSTTPTNTKAPDFSINDTSGKAISLTNFKGKYILIDFWASWCRPCRANNPAIKKVYNQYKDKGLQVLSISIDTDRDAWKKAIIADKMDWLQGSDLLGQKQGTGLQYGIIAVPKYLLINPEGIIIFNGLQFANITSKLNEIFH